MISNTKIRKIQGLSNLAGIIRVRQKPSTLSARVEEVNLRTVSLAS